LCLVEIAASVDKLAKELADESLGALIQVLEISGELGADISTEMRK